MSSADWRTAIVKLDRPVLILLPSGSKEHGCRSGAIHRAGWKRSTMRDMHCSSMMPRGLMPCRKISFNIFRSGENHAEPSPGRYKGHADCGILQSHAWAELF